MTRLDRFIHSAIARVSSGGYECGGDPLPSNGSLVDALRQHPTPIIAELKPSSPSEGQLLQGPAASMLEHYRMGGAAAISCLADADNFGGGPDLIRAAHQTKLPILWKDFVVDEQQLKAAAHHGASAILLIERILDPAQRETLVASAQALGLEVLLEVFNAKDWQTAKESSAELIGVNSRDLESLEVDTDSAMELVATIATERSVVALSGIASRANRQAASERGAIAVLVGTHLMRSHDPMLALQALQRPLAKVCGLQSHQDVSTCAGVGADLVGFVVGSPASPRNIEPIRAQQLSDLAKDAGVRTVLVTSHDDDWEVREWCRLVKPDYVQLHNLDPTPDWLHSLGAIPTTPIRIVRPGASPPPGPFLLDPSDGTGASSAWPAGIGDSASLSLVAGGLEASTAPSMIAHTKAWGADASSQLESKPGVKDPVRIKAYVEACHGA